MERSEWITWRSLVQKKKKNMYFAKHLAVYVTVYHTSVVQLHWRQPWLKQESKYLASIQKAAQRVIAVVATYVVFDNREWCTPSN